MPSDVSDSEEPLCLFVCLPRTLTIRRPHLFVCFFLSYSLIHLGHFVPSIRKVWLYSQFRQIEICAESFWKWWRCSTSLPPAAASSYSLPGEDEVARGYIAISVREQAEN